MIEVQATIDGKNKSFAFDPTKGRANSPALSLINKRLGDLSPTHDAVHRILLKLQKDIFSSEGGAIGKRWPRYNDDERQTYVPMKRAILGREYPLLRWDGGKEVLYPSMTDPTHPKHIWKPKDTSYEFGTSVPYARGHHEGTGLGYKGRYIVPKRELLGSNWDVLGKIIQEVQGYVFGSSGKYAGRGGVFG